MPFAAQVFQAFGDGCARTHRAGGKPALFTRLTPVAFDQHSIRSRRRLSRASLRRRAQTWGSVCRCGVSGLFQRGCQSGVQPAVSTIRGWCAGRTDAAPCRCWMHRRLPVFPPCRRWCFGREGRDLRLCRPLAQQLRRAGLWVKLIWWTAAMSFDPDAALIRSWLEP